MPKSKKTAEERAAEKAAMEAAKQEAAAAAAAKKDLKKREKKSTKKGTKKVKMASPPTGTSTPLLHLSVEEVMEMLKGQQQHRLAHHRHRHRHKYCLHQPQLLNSTNRDS